MNKIWEENDTEQEKIDKLADFCETVQKTGDEQKISDLIAYIKTHSEPTVAFGNYQKYALSLLHLALCKINGEYFRNPFDDNFNPPVNCFETLNLCRKLKGVIFEYQIKAKVNTANILGYFRRFVEAADSLCFDFSQINEFTFVSLEKTYLTILEFIPFIENQEVIKFLDFEGYSALQMMYCRRSQCPNAQLFQELALLEQSRTDATLQLSERLLQMRQVLENGSAVYGMQTEHNFTPPPQNLPQKEFEYKSWCLDNCLFLDFRNLYRPEEWAAAEETLALPKSVSGNFELQMCFSALKSEFDHNRRLLYKILCNLDECRKKKFKAPKNKETLVFSPVYEDLKLFFRNTFGFLDRVVSMLAVYFQARGSVMFAPARIKDLFKKFKDNEYLISLYWLSCDLADNSNVNNWRAPNPAAKEIKQARNALEHNFLLIVDKKSFVPQNANYIKTVTEEELLKMSFDLFKICRNAMFYAALAVAWQERERRKGFVLN